MNDHSEQFKSIQTAAAKAVDRDSILEVGFKIRDDHTSTYYCVIITSIPSQDLFVKIFRTVLAETGISVQVTGEPLHSYT